ncbi:MAG TPA: hypothetical protein VF736_02010, partial [Pyrinomonadaceae bacterium]
MQTEDKGLKTPLILSLVYVGGTIIASKRTPYEDLVSKGFDEEALAERLQRQHKLIIAAIKAGRVDDLKRMAGANGGAAEQAPPGAGAAAAARRPAGQKKKRAEAAAPPASAPPAPLAPPVEAATPPRPAAEAKAPEPELTITSREDPSSLPPAPPPVSEPAAAAGPAGD